MKQRAGKALDWILLIFAAFFLIMGITALGDDAFSVVLGFGTAIPLAAVYAWRKTREARGQSVAIRGGTVALFIAALFFLVMGATELLNPSSDAAYGLIPGLLLAWAYVSRRRKELHSAKAARTQQAKKEEPAAGSPSSSPAKKSPRPVPVTVCPHCGAPGRGNVCEYCGMSKKA